MSSFDVSVTPFVFFSRSIGIRDISPGHDDASVHAPNGTATKHMLTLPLLCVRGRCVGVWVRYE